MRDIRDSAPPWTPSKRRLLFNALDDAIDLLLSEHTWGVFCFIACLECFLEVDCEVEFVPGHSQRVRGRSQKLHFFDTVFSHRQLPWFSTTEPAGTELFEVFGIPALLRLMCFIQFKGFTPFNPCPTQKFSHPLLLRPFSRGISFSIQSIHRGILRWPWKGPPQLGHVHQKGFPTHKAHSPKRCSDSFLRYPLFLRVYTLGHSILIDYTTISFEKVINLLISCK